MTHTRKSNKRLFIEKYWLVDEDVTDYILAQIDKVEQELSLAIEKDNELILKPESSVYRVTINGPDQVSIPYDNNTYYVNGIKMSPGIHPLPKPPIK